MNLEQTLTVLPGTHVSIFIWSKYLQCYEQYMPTNDLDLLSREWLRIIEKKPMRGADIKKMKPTGYNYMNVYIE